MKAFKSLIKRDESFLIINHNDADGLASAGIMCGTFYREDARFTIRTIQSFSDFINDYNEKYIDADNIIFVDIGSGYLDEIENIFPNRVKKTSISSLLFTKKEDLLLYLMIILVVSLYFEKNFKEDKIKPVWPSKDHLNLMILITG